MAHGQPCTSIFAQGTRTVGRPGVCAFGLKPTAVRGLLHDRAPTGSLPRLFFLLAFCFPSFSPLFFFYSFFFSVLKSNKTWVASEEALVLGPELDRA